MFLVGLVTFLPCCIECGAVYGHEKNVYPSVCPSVKRVYCDKTKGRSVQILYHTEDHLA